MALFGNNTKVDTPFDNYKERQEERQRLLVGHVPPSPIYMSQEAVFFLVSIVMCLFQKCFTIKDAAIWSVAVVIVVGLWSVTMRFFISKADMLINVFLNTFFVLTCNLGIVWLINILLKMPVTLSDYVTLSPLALGFMMISYEFHAEDYFDYREDVLFPTIRGIISTMVVAVICHFFMIQLSFFTVLLSALVLLLMSRVESLIYKRDYLYAPVPPYSAFKSVPNKEPMAFLRFFSYRIILFIAMIVASIVSIIVTMIGERINFALDRFNGLLVAVVMIIFIAIVEFIPFFKSERKNRSRNARFMRYYEYPFICAAVCVGLGMNIPLWKYGIYLLFIVLLDLYVAGYMISLPRRLLFTRKNKYYSGAPAILVNISLLVMVINLLFMIY